MIHRNEHFSGERALFRAENADLQACVFEDGESPLKESRDISAEGCRFLWRYPLWYGHHIHAENCYFSTDARASLWYTDDLVLKHCLLDAPKSLRRCHRMALSDITVTGGDETLWDCHDVSISHATVKGEYFAMNSTDLTIDHLTLDGKYSFDGVKNVTLRHCDLTTKDAFWNSENVTVYDSVIRSEYLGWNSKNLTFVNCRIQSNQGLCFIDSLVLKNCNLEGTTLAFEYCTVDAELNAPIDSILNPRSGRISAPSIGTLILQKEVINPEATEIRCPDIRNRRDCPEWICP